MSAEMTCHGPCERVNVFPLDIYKEKVLQIVMARPKRKTAVTTLKMTPEIRDLWERCAAAEVRPLTNMFEVMVRSYARQLGIEPMTPVTPEQTKTT